MRFSLKRSSAKPIWIRQNKGIKDWHLHKKASAAFPENNYCDSAQKIKSQLRRKLYQFLRARPPMVVVPKASPKG